MQRPPIFPMHVGDYLGDTGHLTTLEHGAYHLLLYHYWRTGPLVADDKHLASIARMKIDHWTRIRETIQRFFVAKDGHWFHVRVQKEFAYANEKSIRRQMAGRLGGLEKSRKNSSNATILLEQTPSKLLASSSSSSSIEERKDSRAVTVVTRPKYDETFERFWKVYPKREGANPKAPAERSFRKEIKRGFDPEIIIAGAERYNAVETKAGRVGTPYICQAVTWLNQNRWGDYNGASHPLLERHERPKPP